MANTVIIRPKSSCSLIKIDGHKHAQPPVTPPTAEISNQMQTIDHSKFYLKTEVSQEELSNKEFITNQTSIGAILAIHVSNKNTSSATSSI